MDFHNTSLNQHEQREDQYLDLPAVREFVQEHAGCDWEDALDWLEQVSGRSVPEEQWGEVEKVWEEESQTWGPSDDDMMSAFGTKWHDGL